MKTLKMTIIDTNQKNIRTCDSRNKPFWTKFQVNSELNLKCTVLKQTEVSRL